MTSLQLGLIVGGIALVLGVLVYNWLQVRRVRQRLAAPVRKNAPAPAPPSARIEPSLAGSDGGRDAEPAARRREPEPGVNPARDVREDPAAEAFVPPVHYEPTPADVPDGVAAAPVAPLPAPPGEGAPEPDADVECIATLRPTRPVAAAALAAGLAAGLGKRLRWFGRETAQAPWQLLGADARGEWTELAACLLLADRKGAASKALLERFLQLVRDQATTLEATVAAPDVDGEVARAEALDRLCADVDVQIGLTLLKTGPALIAGTRLRGVAEAAGFRLAPIGRFEWIQEDSGSVLYTLQNIRPEPFTPDGLRLSSTPGVVFLLDVPRVADPVKAFDQMKQGARRMAQTLEATLVDDNRRPLTDGALAAIREQVKLTATALQAMRIEPGSPRALALFGG